jgi:hypothetical protein
MKKQNTAIGNIGVIERTGINDGRRRYRVIPNFSYHLNQINFCLVLKFI